MQKLSPAGNILLFQFVDCFGNQRQFYTRINEQARFSIADFAFRGVQFGVKILVTDEDNLLVRLEGIKAIGTCPDWKSIYCNIPIFQRSLFIKVDDLLGHRCEEGHRQPVNKLWIFGFKDDLVGVTVNDLDSRKCEGIYIQSDRILTFIDGLVVGGTRRSPAFLTLCL